MRPGVGSRRPSGWEGELWHSVHLVLVGALVLTLIVVFAIVCRWYVDREQRRRRGRAPGFLSPTGYPMGHPATGGF
jgi:hypothetical protein